MNLFRRYKFAETLSVKNLITINGYACFFITTLLSIAALAINLMGSRIDPMIVAIGLHSVGVSLSIVCVSVDKRLKELESQIEELKSRVGNTPVN